MMVHEYGRCFICISFMLPVDDFSFKNACPTNVKNQKIIGSIIQPARQLVNKPEKERKPFDCLTLIQCMYAVHF